jgi:hypothetical protein
MSVSSRPSLSSFTQSEDYKHLRSRSEELTHREDDCHLHDFDSSHLTPRKIKSTVCLNKPTHPGDDCHPHAFQLIPLPNSRNTKSLKLLLLGTYSTQRRSLAFTPFSSFHLNSRNINTSNCFFWNLLNAETISPLHLPIPFTQFEIYKLKSRRRAS